MSESKDRIRMAVSGNRITYIHDDRLPGGDTRRASHVEPSSFGWTVDLGPVGGPFVYGFPTRAEALAAERGWIEANLGDIAEAGGERDVRQEDS